MILGLVNPKSGGARRIKKKQIMMAERAIARDACDALLEKSIRHCPEVARDISHQPGLQKSETRGGAGRSRPAEGQVNGGVAMLPVQTCRQPSCFHGKAVQAPFVFGSTPRGWLTGGTLAREHPTMQLLRVYAQAPLLARPSRRVEAARVEPAAKSIPPP